MTSLTSLPVSVLHFLSLPDINPSWQRSAPGHRALIDFNLGADRCRADGAVLRSAHAAGSEPRPCMKFNAWNQNRVLTAGTSKLPHSLNWFKLV